MASVILRRGVELRYKDYSLIKISLSLFGLTMHPKHELLKRKFKINFFKAKDK